MVRSLLERLGSAADTGLCERRPPWIPGQKSRIGARQKQIAFTPCSRAKRFISVIGSTLDPQTAVIHAGGPKVRSAASGQIAFPRSTAVASFRSSLLPVRTSIPRSTNSAAADGREAPLRFLPPHRGARNREQRYQRVRPPAVPAAYPLYLDGLREVVLRVAGVQTHLARGPAGWTDRPGPQGGPQRKYLCEAIASTQNVDYNDGVCWGDRALVG